MFRCSAHGCRTLAAALTAILILAAAAQGQEGGYAPHQPAPSGAAPLGQGVRVSTPPELDGRLDDVAWTEAPVISGFVQREPFEGRSASERTEVRIVYDDEALFIGAWLLDSDPAAIVQGEARRDVDLDDMDAFLIVLDTYRDRQNAFVFGTTPAGIEYDGQVTKEGEGGSREGASRLGLGAGSISTGTVAGMLPPRWTPPGGTRSFASPSPHCGTEAGDLSCGV